MILTETISHPKRESHSVPDSFENFLFAIMVLQLLRERDFDFTKPSTTLRGAGGLSNSGITN